MSILKPHEADFFLRESKECYAVFFFRFDWVEYFEKNIQTFRKEFAIFNLNKLLISSYFALKYSQ